MLFDFTAKIKSIQFLLLSLRWYLIVYMLIYGIQKIALNQFGVYDQSILQTPLEDVDTFYIAWFLFQKSVFFNISTGFIEFLAGILLIFNRTVIIGALLTLTVLIQIFILDTAFTTETLGYSLPIRLGGMIFCNLIILYSFRKRLFLALSILTKIKSKFL